MKKLSIEAAWNETAAFVKRDFGLLFLIAFGLIVLPSIIVQAFMPPAGPAEPPEAGSWMLLLIPAIALSIVGSLTISILALGRAVDAREAVALAVRRFLPVFLAALLFGLLAVVAVFPLGLVAALIGGTGPGGIALATAAVAAALLFMWVRMMLLNPVGAAEPIGPAAILKRSWRLTAGHFWRLLGFFAVVLLVFIVLTLAVSAVFGTVILLLAGPPQESGLSRVLMLLVNGVLGAAVGLFLTVMVARIYAQLASEPTSGT